MAKTFKLSKPIKINGDKGIVDKSDIVLRDPIADDVFEFGLPFTIIREGDRVEIKPDGPALKAWLPRLAGMSAGEFGAIPARHVMTMFNWLSGELADAGNSD